MSTKYITDWPAKCLGTRLQGVHVQFDTLTEWICGFTLLITPLLALRVIIHNK